jgi:beta-lactamase class D
MMKFHHAALAALGAFVALSTAQAREVCTAIADAGSGAVLMQRGDCSSRVTPASTFKIAISLMGYDSGFLKDAHTPLLPYREGYVDWRENWKQPTDPTKWIKDSVVWYSQQVTQSLGKQRFADYTRRFQYGNADVTGDAEHDGLTLAWIHSSLQISPLEQLGFLEKVVNRQLGVSPHAYDMTTVITRAEQAPDGWDMHGKTGAAGGWGWYVGWVSKDAHTYVFARLIHDDAGETSDIPAGFRARDAFMADFPALMSALPR